jgi:5'-3' exonuclease
VSEQPRSIGLVDISYLFKRNYMAMPRDASPGDAAAKTLENLAAIRDSVDHVIVCCDTPPYKRNEVFFAYKATREKPQHEENAQKRWLLERLELDGYVIARHKGSEADDVIATLAAVYSTWCSDVRIIGCDKDLAQCVDTHVRMYVPPSGRRPAEVRDVEGVRVKYGVSPEEMPLWLALCGDKGDNVPGIPGIGPKRATEIIREHKTLSGIEAALQGLADDPEPSAMWQAIATNWDSLVMSLRLVTLDREVPLDCEALLTPRAPETVREDVMNSDITEADYAPLPPPPPMPDAVRPEPTKAAPKSDPPPAPATSTAIVREDFGMVDEELQPRDLKSARNISKWVHSGRLYPNFPTPESVFTIILRGKELGLGVTTSLAGFHLIEGRPSASADLIRSLAERHENCEYFRFVESSPTSATWETKHRRHPEPIRYTYTIEEARAAGLSNGNWAKRPRDMLTKTAGAKLARLVYPGAVLGLYCADEMVSES